jgi:glycosyltransferase involved in cell wall biosynthesis
VRYTGHMPKRIVIDARESGTTTGRYIDKLIEHLHSLQTPYHFVVLTKSPRLEFMRSIAPKFEVISSDFKEFTFAEQLGLLRQLNALKPDLVFFSMVQQPVLYRGRVVTTMQDLTTLRFRNRSKNWLVFTFKREVYRHVNKYAARKSVNLITPSQFVKEDVMQFTGVPASKITVTHEAADLIKDKPEAVPDLSGKQFIMYVGRPLEHKNLPRLIDAFVELQSSHPELRLVLAGKKDDLYERIADDVRRRDIKNVVFTGFVSEGQLRWLYQQTACYVFPSLSEGFGLPSIEAMLHGAPVAASNATCLPEVNRDGAVYFDPDDVADMARAIDSVISNDQLAAKLRRQGALVAKSYSWDRMAQQTLNVLSKSL